jgi:hypothetical protein
MNDKFSSPSHIAHLLPATAEREEECALETYIQAYKELAQRIAELEEQKKQFGSIILQQMKAKTMSIAGYVVRKCERLNVRTDLQKAREWNATKMEEVIDKDKLKQLYQAGHTIPGISISQFIQICDNKKAPVG